jgi:regulatory protein
MARKELRAAPTAYGRALRRLAARDRSERELERDLLARGHEPAEVAATLRRLRSEHYLDDRRFAEQFARSRIAGQGLGRLRVRQGLRERGVERKVAEAGLAAALQEVPEEGVVDGLARRYWTQHRAEAPEKRLRKLWAFLLRRGFPAGLVGDRLRALWPRHEDALEGLEPVDGDEI